MTTLVFKFKKIQSNHKTLHCTFCSNSKVKTITNESDIDHVFKSIYSSVISKIKKSLGQELGWIINSVIDHTVNISKHNSSARPS